MYAYTYADKLKNILQTREIRNESFLQGKIFMKFFATIAPYC